MQQDGVQTKRGKRMSGVGEDHFLVGSLTGRKSGWALASVWKKEALGEASRALVGHVLP